MTDAPNGEPVNLWYRWEEKRYRAMIASRPRRIREAVQALIVEGMSPEEYRAKWRADAERLAGRES